jgi:translation initiation factor 5A|tara:strand:- start:594 stop:983 length:390 start_codon:yes stop_codon:yes gene_type:complete
MVLKLIHATAAKSGTTILWESIPCSVRSNDISKTGKHGHAKCRMEVVGIFDGKKRVGVVPGSEKLEVPLVEKNKAQVLSVSENSASIMDLESFETIDIPFQDELKNKIKAEDQVEYWNVEGHKAIMKVL